MAAQGLTVKMTVDKETPGTLRFKEDTAPGETAVIGTLYVPKASLKKIGVPQKILVTVEAAS
jgi:hypothetical protein